MDVDFIQDRACERITEILDALGMEYTERHDYIQAACPVHGGNNDRGMFWAIRSNHWQCKTRGCHSETITGPSSSVFGLVRGAMTRKTEKPWTFKQSVSFVVQALGLDTKNADKRTSEEIEIAKLLKQNKKKVKRLDDKRLLLSAVVGKLKPDTMYYPGRGIDKDIIARYNISYCDTRGKAMYKRAFFPILDITGRYIVGWSGRSIYDKCQKCSMYHHPKRQKCPDKKYRSLYPKWKHSTKFSAEDYLYNIWFAKPFISRTGTVILCEGPGDVWALEAAGIRNSVAIFGLSISRKQRLLLQNSGALTILCAFDNDEAGNKAGKKIQESLNHYFRVFRITPQNNTDFADMSKSEICDKMDSFLQKV